jgi:hypothetical protein
MQKTNKKWMRTFRKYSGGKELGKNPSINNRRHPKM